MKRIVLICTALFAGYAQAEVFVKNHTDYDIVVQISWKVAGRTFEEGFKGNKINAHTGGFVTDPLGNKTEDHAWTKVRYQVKANTSKNPKSDIKDWVLVYDTTTDPKLSEYKRNNYEAGGYRNLDIFTHTDERGNPVFDVLDSVRLPGIDSDTVQ